MRAYWSLCQEWARCRHTIALFSHDWRLKVLQCIFLTIVLSFFSMLSMASQAQENDVAIVSTDAKRPFTILDSIGMKRIVDIDLPIVANKVSRFEFSPDGSHFYVVIMHGDIVSDLNQFEFRIFNTQDVLAHVNDKQTSSLSPGRDLIRLGTASNAGLFRHYAIREARWIDNRTIAYIGDDGVLPGQVFTVDIESGETRRLTNHSRNIESFGFSGDRRTIVFLSTLKKWEDDYQDVAIVAGLRSRKRLANLGNEPRIQREFQFYTQPVEQGSMSRAFGSSFQASIFPAGQVFWPSEDGSKMIAAIPFEDMPDEATDFYLPIKNSGFARKTLEDYDPNIARPNRQSFFKFVLIDLNSEKRTDLLDGTPAGFAAGGLTLKAIWMPDGENVLLATTYLPAIEEDSVERSLRRQTPSIVQYNIVSGEYDRITSITVPIGARSSPKPFFDMVLSDEKVLEIRLGSLTGAQDGAGIESYQMLDGEWFDIKPNEDIRRLKLSHQQDLNTPPELWATDTATGKEAPLTDLNPTFRNIDMGRAETINWVDRKGREWRGGIMYPPRYSPEEKYGLVIQTHGFGGKDTFWVDGRMSGFGPYGARALAGRGLIVVQLPNHPEGRGTREELFVHQDGIEAIIDLLDEKGVIDRNRVGIAGHSRTGFYVDHAITFSTYSFAAAAITDSSNLNFSYYSHYFALLSPGMRYMETMFGGAVPWGDGVSKLTERSSTFNLDKVKTPVRMEVYLDNQNYSGVYWDNYTIMRRLGKPVELVLFPKANHSTINPAARLASAGGIVDWFDFWLNEREDLAPSKTEQYERWRDLREQQSLSEQNANAARVMATGQ